MKRKNCIASMRLPGKHPNGYVGRDKEDKMYIRWSSGEDEIYLQSLTGLTTRENV
jgi:hypothetical protein